jgi:superoxide dismutase, Fe-Mn family
MAGSGYVWLVTDNSGQLAVLPTFAAGTLLVRARQQTTPNSGPILGEIFGHQAASGSTTSPTSPASGVVPPSASPTTPPHARAFSTTTTARAESLLSSYDPSDPTALADTPLTPVPKSRNLRNMGDIIWPLFALPVLEHCGMSAGFGVWGQEEWIRKFWTVLDWKKVSDAFAAHAVDRKGPIA